MGVINVLFNSAKISWTILSPYFLFVLIFSRFVSMSVYCSSISLVHRHLREHFYFAFRSCQKNVFLAVSTKREFPYDHGSNINFYEIYLPLCSYPYINYQDINPADFYRFLIRFLLFFSDKVVNHIFGDILSILSCSSNAFDDIPY